MKNEQPRLEDEEWLRAHQSGPRLRVQLSHRRGSLVGGLALARLIVIIVIGERTGAPAAKPAAIRSPSATTMPFFGLFPVFAYDAGHRQVVLLNFRDQTWLWSKNQWVLAHPSVAPPRRTGAAFAWDPRMNAVLLFGGLAYGDQTVLHDTWTWDGVHCQPRSVSGGPTSPMAATAFDPNTRTVLAIAGLCPGFECASQTWSWNGTTWHRLTPAHEPSFAFYNMALVPDPLSRRLVLLTVSATPLGQLPRKPGRGTVGTGSGSS